MRLRYFLTIYDSKLYENSKITSLMASGGSLASSQTMTYSCREPYGPVSQAMLYEWISHSLAEEPSNLKIPPLAKPTKLQY